MNHTHRSSPVHSVVNPGYDDLIPFINDLPDAFRNEKKLIHQGRNTVKLMEAGALKLVVKSFRPPHIINKIAYTYLRRSKAERSYRYSLEILQRGFHAPTPVAYIEEFRGGFLNGSYYVSEYCDYERSFKEFRHYRPFEGKEDILVAFAEFVARLQEAGIYHKDLSNGNILFKKNDGKIEFCLVDVNRMSFGNIDKTQGYKNFKRLWIRDKALTIIAERYALSKGFDVEESIRKILRYNRRSIGAQPAFFNDSLTINH